MRSWQFGSSCLLAGLILILALAWNSRSYFPVLADDLQTTAAIDLGLSGQPGSDVTDEPQPFHPLIRGHGQVFALPELPFQPRPDTKVLIDVTGGGDPAKLNGSVEKLARYVNIYAGAGREPVAHHFAVILHGETTLTALRSSAYADRFQTGDNPNLELLMTLREAGVELYVCGQTILAKGQRLEDVADCVQPVVSAFTAVINLQEDGYRLVPLGD